MEVVKWKPGQSGNPNGRPKGAVGLARYIREHSLDGRKLADFLVRVVDCEDGTVDKCKVTMDHKLEAVRILLNRGFGRPVEQLVVEGSSSLSDIIAQAYARRRAIGEGDEGESIKDAQATITDAPREGEQAQEATGEEENAKTKISRDSKGESRVRGAGGAS